MDLAAPFVAQSLSVGGACAHEGREREGERELCRLGIHDDVIAISSLWICSGLHRSSPYP
jgi:hypothetical protein